MTLYCIYRQKEYFKYASNEFSKATLFQIIFSFTPLFVALISAYRAYGFYNTSAFVLTQPTINMKSDMILKFLNANNSAYVWSNLMPTTSNCVPTISIVEADTNYDGIKESVHITIRLYKTDVIGVRILLQFDYLISGISTVQLQQPIVISADAAVPMGRLGVVGRLAMVQKRRLPSSGTTSIYNTTLLSAASDSRVLENAFSLAVQNVSARNYTVKLKDLYTTYDSLPANQGFVDISLFVLYSPEILHFHAEFWNMVKWAWVQWFYFLVIFMFGFQRFKEFVYDSYTVSATRTSTQLHQCEPVPTYTTEF